MGQGSGKTESCLLPFESVTVSIIEGCSVTEQSTPQASAVSSSLGSHISYPPSQDTSGRERATNNPPGMASRNWDVWQGS